MKVYFAASGRGYDQLGDHYNQIYELIESLGNNHVDDTLGNIDSDEFYSGSREDQVNAYKQTEKHIRACDVVVVEVSLHSLSMGFVMQRALEVGKPTIALYLKGKIPHFALVVENEKLQVIEYTKEDLSDVLKDALDYSKDAADTRFNFFISPRHASYLDWVAKTKRVPRSVFLRNIIKKDMKANADYK
jgi:hypothetical protein